MDPGQLAAGHGGGVQHLVGAGGARAGVVALVFTNAQIKRNRKLAAERARPHVAMLMERHAADRHVIELVVRNLGQTAADDIPPWPKLRTDGARVSSTHPPTSACGEATKKANWADITASASDLVSDLIQSTGLARAKEQP